MRTNPLNAWLRWIYDTMIMKHKTCAVILKDKKFLVVRNEGRKIWTSPGGHVEEDETAEQCMMRELSEELGFLPERMEPYGELEVPSPIEPDVVMRLTFFLIKTDSDKEFQIIDPEIEELMWVDSKYDGSKGKLIPDLSGWLMDKLVRDDLVE